MRPLNLLESIAGVLDWQVASSPAHRLQQSDEQRARFMAEVSVYDPYMLIWIDESGCDRRHSRRKRAYSLRGITPVDHRILIRGTHYSATPVMSTQGIHDICLIEGSVNGEVFESFLRSHILQPFIHCLYQSWIMPLFTMSKVLDS